RGGGDPGAAAVSRIWVPAFAGTNGDRARVNSKPTWRGDTSPQTGRRGLRIRVPQMVQATVHAHRDDVDDRGAAALHVGNRGLEGAGEVRWLLDPVGAGAERVRERTDVDALVETRHRKLLALAAVGIRRLAVFLDDDEGRRVVADRGLDVHRGLVERLLADEGGDELVGLRLLGAHGGADRPAHGAGDAEAEKRARARRDIVLRGGAPH